MCNELGKGRPRHWGKAGLGDRLDRRRLLDSSKNKHNPVMVYNDLMINNTSVSNYNINRSQPVTIQCPITWVGAPVDRRRQTGMLCPNRALISVRIIVPFFRMASRPLSAAHQLMLTIYILFNYTCHLGGTPQAGTYLIYESTL